jgi:predicted transcriptional regulator
MFYKIRKKDMKYRDKIDIISQILKIANGGGVTRTKIMYKGLLSYTQIKEYLMLLTEKDLLYYDKDSQTFKTTEKGLRFLDTYNRIGEMFDELQQQRQMWIQREEEKV